MTTREDYDGPAAPPRRGPLLAGVAALGLHAVFLVIAGIFLLVRSTGHDATSHRAAVTQGFFALLGALIFAGLAALLAPRRVVLAARTPAMMLEAILLPVAIGLFQSGRPELGAPLLLSAMVALVGIPLGTRGLA